MQRGSCLRGNLVWFLTGWRCDLPRNHWFVRKPLPRQAGNVFSRWIVDLFLTSLECETGIGEKYGRRRYWNPILATTKTFPSPWHRRGHRGHWRLHPRYSCRGLQKIDCLWADRQGWVEGDWPWWEPVLYIWFLEGNGKVTIRPVVSIILGMANYDSTFLPGKIICVGTCGSMTVQGAHYHLPIGGVKFETNVVNSRRLVTSTEHKAVIISSEVIGCSNRSAYFVGHTRCIKFSSVDIDVLSASLGPYLWLRSFTKFLVTSLCVA